MRQHAGELDGPISAGHQVRPGRAEDPWLIYRAARWVMLGVRLVAIWWPLAPLWITLLIWPPLAVLPAMAVGVAVVPVGRWRWLVAWRARVRGWMGWSLARTYTWAWRALWPKICGLAGLSIVLSHRSRVPELVRVERGPGVWPAWTTLVVRPLGAQDPESWDRIEDRLRRVTKHAASLSWQDPTGALVVRLFRRALPDIAPVDLTQIGGVEDEVVLGVSADGDLIRWAVDERPHATVVGVTGGGKGILLRLVLAHAVLQGWEIRVLNPKRSGEYGWLTGRASIAKTLPGMAAMVADTHALMQARQDLIEAAGADTWHDVETLVHRVVLVLDESASLIGTGNKGDDAPLRRQVAGQLAAIVAMGRSAGVHVVMVTQHPVADAFGPSGSTMKTNTGARIVVGGSPPEGLRMMFGPSLAPAVAQVLSSGRPGRCLYQGCDPDKGPRITAGQIYHATQPALAAVTEAMAPVVGVRDFDHETQHNNNDDDDAQGEVA